MNHYNSTRVQAPDYPAKEVGSSDATGLKPTGGPAADDIGQSPEPDPRKNQKTTEIPKKSGIIGCRRETVVGTLNVRTIRDDCRKEVMVNRFLSSGVSVMGVQEHRICHGEDVQVERGRGFCFVSSSAWRSGSGAACGGVGMFLTEEAYRAVKLVKPYTNRILLVSFSGNPALTVVCVYSPTEGSDAEEALLFHQDLRAAIHEVPAHDLLLVVGDLNAHLSRTSPEDSGFYLHPTSNRNGTLLRDTMVECGLVAGNHLFQKKTSKLHTFTSDGTLCKSQIDYILIRSKWRNSLRNLEVVDSFGDVGSDHRAVLGFIRLSLRKTKRPKGQIRYDFTQLKEDTDFQDVYSVEVNNRFDVLKQDVELNDASGRYGAFVTAVTETNSRLLPRKRKRSHDTAMDDPRVHTDREELFVAKRAFFQDPTEESRCVVSEKKEALSATHALVTEEIISKKIRRVEAATDERKSKEAWDLIRDVTGGGRPGGLVEGGSAEGRLESWRNHFSGILGAPPDVPDEDLIIHTVSEELPISTDQFTAVEFDAARRSIKEGKASGEDGVPPEVLKRGGVSEIMLNFYNDALENGSFPDQWRNLLIVPVPKKGDLSRTSNYRGISLTSVALKTLNKIILNRLLPHIEPILRDNQNGFRPGRSTTSHILALRRLLEGVTERKLTSVILFIDFKRAFDSLHRGILMRILRAYGIPEKLVKLIQCSYEDTLARVKTEDGLTEAIAILAGVLQGDTLAPYLFIIVIDYVMREALAGRDVGFTLRKRKSSRHPEVKISDTDYADDLSLLTDTIDQAQEFLLSLESAAAAVGLHLNEGKTKFMATGYEDPSLVSTSGRQLEWVEDFVYLGAHLRSTEHDFNVRKAKAWAACHRLRSVWKTDLRRSCKVNLFRTTVEAILLYGAETWTLTSSLEKRLDGCHSNMLRMALGINWWDKVRNEEVYQNIPRVSDTVRARRLRLAGHIQRHPELTAHQLLFWEPDRGNRSRGRPHKTFLKQLRDDAGLASDKEIQDLMQNRELWRDMVARTRKPP